MTRKLYEYHFASVEGSYPGDPHMRKSLEAMNEHFGWRTVDLIHVSREYLHTFLMEREVGAEKEPTEFQEANREIQEEVDQLRGELVHMSRELAEAKAEHLKLQKASQCRPEVEKTLEAIETEWYRVARSSDPQEFVQYHATVNIPVLLEVVRHVLAENTLMRKTIQEEDK